MNDYSNYYFFDFHNFRKWVSFSILVDSESGFMELYQYSYLKKSGAITSCARISVYEADGGAIRNDELNYSRSGRKLKVYSKYSYSQSLFADEDLTDCYLLDSDSTIYSYCFGKRKMNYTVDSIYRIQDTICN